MKNNRDNSRILFYIYMVITMLIVVGVVVGLTFLDNKSKSSYEGYLRAQKEAQEKKGIYPSEIDVEVLSDRKLTSDELDIWTLPPTGRKNKETTTKEKKDEKQVSKDSPKDEEKTDTSLENLDAAKEENENSAVSYDKDSFVLDKNLMHYYVDGKDISKQGIEISWQQGSVNMKRLKNAGYDFVMLYVGTRGYVSGKVVFDDNFKKNLDNVDRNFEDFYKRAKEAGLKVGVIFKSFAITKEEAKEEADTLLTAIMGYAISYPVVIEFASPEDDLARTDLLTKEDRTNIAKYFIEQINDAGKTACIYANNDILTNGINLEELPECKLWLSDPGSKPDTDKEIFMWQYANATVYGVTNETRLSVSLASN